MDKCELVAAANTEPKVYQIGRRTGRQFTTTEFTFGVLVPDANHPLSCVSVANMIQSGEYYPGLYQCLLLPSPLLAYDTKGFTTETVNNFSSIVSARLNQERDVNPESSILNAHPRKAILAPGRYE